MPEFDIVKCKHCGGDIAVSQGESSGELYHRNCAWYAIPCDICGESIRIHRDWDNSPRAHKECKQAAKEKRYEKPCLQCGKPISVHENAVTVPRLCRPCESQARKASLATKAPPKERLHVFLCHSSSDKPRIRELYRPLWPDGIAPWLDEEKLLPGHDWHHEINKAVRSSHIVIVCLSHTSISKTGYIQKEIKHALDVADEQPEGTIFLIPLKLEECDCPDRLQRWQWVKLFEPEGYDRLMRALKERARAINVSNVA